MPLVKYVGVDLDENGNDLGGRNLGRFGFVKTGQTLNLSDEEFAHVDGHENFEPFNPLNAEKPAAAVKPAKVEKAEK